MDIPEDMKAKLKIIEQEREFFSHSPKDPGHWSWILAVIACPWLLLLIWPAGKNDQEDFLMRTLGFCVITLSVAIYYYRRKIFHIYTVASQIIKYYKSKGA